jgi:perosamine synthetase
MRKLSKLLNSAKDFLMLKRNINFYFSTIKISDALYALFYSICTLLRLPVAQHGRQTFLRVVEKKFGPREAFLYGSARSALCNHLRCLELEPQAEVIITGFTCEAVPNAVIQAGLKPVYADIDPTNFGLSPRAVQQRISAKSRLLLIQHTFGIPADIDELLEIAQRYDLYVIEDCAVSLGSRYKNKLTGTLGDAAIFSFELSKTITSCRGGMLFVNNNKLDAVTKHREYYKNVPEQTRKYAANTLFQLGLSGILYRPIIYNIGKFILTFLFKTGYFKKSTTGQELEAELPDNYLLKLSDAQAILLIGQWNRIDKIVAQSQEIVSYYYHNLNEIDGVTLLPPQEDALVNFIRFPILVESRQRLDEAFLENGQELGLWFTAPLSSPDINHELFGYVYGSCPKAEEITTKVCNLPTSLRTKGQDLEKISRIINSTCAPSTAN